MERSGGGGLQSVGLHELTKGAVQMWKIVGGHKKKRMRVVRNTGGGRVSNRRERLNWGLEIQRACEGNSFKKYNDEKGPGVNKEI